MVIASPALATVYINAVNKGGGVVEVNYLCIVGEKVRSFALDIDINNGVTIDNIRDFNTGESNRPAGGYGIFPGSFRDYINAASPNWFDPCYNPVAPAGDPAARPGLGTGAITVELGSLYVDTNSPGNSGTLFVLDCNPHGAAFSDITIAVNTTRRGVVLEDGNVVTPSISGSPFRIWFIYAPSAPTKLLYPKYDSDCNVPIYWSAANGTDNYELERAYNDGGYANIYTGNATNKGDLKVNPGLYRYRVRACNGAGCSNYFTGTYDCNAYLSTCYRDGNTDDPNWNNWVAVGRPDCWCKAVAAAVLEPNGSGYQCDGDADGVTSGTPFFYRVYNNDLVMVTSNWQKTAAQITSDPNVTLAGKLKIHSACADFDHKSSGTPFNYRVYNNDITKVSSNWMKLNSSSVTATNRLPGDCPR
jgi:hypothetical protein